LTGFQEPYQWILRICSIGLLIDTLEQLDGRRALEDGLYSWTILRRRLDRAPRLLRDAADLLCTGSSRPVIFLLSRLPALVVVAWWPIHSVPFAVALSTLLVTQLYHFLRRCSFGILGSDQMNLVVIGSSWLCIVVAPKAAAAGLWFMTVQSCLSYAVNGAAKLAAPKWRSGRAMPAIFATHSFGHPTVLRMLVAMPRLNRFLCWLVIVWECSFPLVLVVASPVRLGILATGIFFHAMIAVTMGIHLFIWAFIATYPAIWWSLR
jgi:hypothetical protein